MDRTFIGNNYPTSLSVSSELVIIVNREIHSAHLSIRLIMSYGQSTRDYYRYSGRTTSGPRKYIRCRRRRLVSSLLCMIFDFYLKSLKFFNTRYEYIHARFWIQAIIIGISKKTILICDDEPDLLELFELVLKLNYDVIPVDSGEACIATYTKEKSMGNKIDLILLDYKLRDMLGDYVARKIRSYNGTNIILISGYELDEKLIKELEDGNYIGKFVKKPIQNNQLNQLVAEIIC
jgi:CheY-like chemotaxis protein